MKRYFDILLSPENRKLTLLMLLSGIAFVIAALIIGIADNPPGITVIFVGIILLFLAFIHFWRSEKSYLFLMLFSFLGGVVFAVSHNLLDAFNAWVPDIIILSSVIEGLSAASFMIAVLLCPVGILVGFFGAILTYFLKLNPKKTAE